MNQRIIKLADKLVFKYGIDDNEPSTSVQNISYKKPIPNFLQEKLTDPGTIKPKNDIPEHIKQFTDEFKSMIHSVYINVHNELMSIHNKHNNFMELYPESTKNLMNIFNELFTKDYDLNKINYENSSSIANHMFIVINHNTQNLLKAYSDSQNFIKIPPHIKLKSPVKILTLGSWLEENK